MRPILFKVLNGGVLVLTMTDFGNLYLRRSALPVHFAYVFHSLVSTHMIYRTRAFEHYDLFLCCGPHHAAGLSSRMRPLTDLFQEMTDPGAAVHCVTIERGGRKSTPSRTTKKPLRHCKF